MDRAQGMGNKQRSRVNVKVNIDDTLIIRPLDSWILKIMARAVVMAVVFVLLVQPINGGLSSNFNKIDIDTFNVEMLRSLFKDLENEGLLKTGGKALFVSSGNGSDERDFDLGIVANTQIDLVSLSDLQRQRSIADDTFDFAFVHGSHAASAARFIDRTLRVGGVAVVHLRGRHSGSFAKPSNYRFVYLCRSGSAGAVNVAIQKTGYRGTRYPSRRLLHGVSSEAKKAALNKLEDVLLEPPRAKSRRSKTYLKRTRYLPDLTGDSLESYPRRVFIDVGSPEKGDDRWFAKHYPTRNKDFVIYKVEAVAEDSSGVAPPQIGMAEWLRKNVKEEEYVVMKAEAEVVEETLKNRATSLVDELFLECGHRGLSGKGGRRRSARAYWEYLALYGKLRDEGVAVHQWWG